MHYLDISLYAIFVLSIAGGVIYDVVTKQPPASAKNKTKIFVEFIFDQALHFVMLIVLIAGARGVDAFTQWVNGGEWVLFPKHPESEVSFDQFLRLFDLSCFLVTLHYLVRGLVDVFRGI